MNIEKRRRIIHKVVDAINDIVEDAGIQGGYDYCLVYEEDSNGIYIKLSNLLLWNSDEDDYVFMKNDENIYEEATEDEVYSQLYSHLKAEIKEIKSNFKKIKMKYL